ncbi:MAG: glycosyltransferase family 4 protein [Terriglobales bacterium]
MLPRPAPRVLIVEFFSRGGLIHYSLQLARALATQALPGTEIIVLTSRHSEAAAPAGVRLRTDLATWNPHRPLRFWPRRLVRAARGIIYVRAWWQILRTVRRLRPRLVLLTDLEHRCDAWFVPRLRRVCHELEPAAALADIWHNVEPFDRYHSGQLLRRLRWRAPMARQFDTIFVHGRTLAHQFTTLTGCQPCVIPHGNQNWMAEQAGPDPHLNERFRLPAERPLALLFGALSSYKGVDVLLAAMAALPSARRPLLLIAGMPTADTELGKWQRQATKDGLDAWVRWDPRYVPMPEVAWYFRRADWVVLPYRVASQSGIGHIALTFGKPLLVTASGGLPELIDGNGLIVPPDDTAALAVALARFTGEPDSRRRWALRSAELAGQRHGWLPIARAVLKAAAGDLLAPDPQLTTKAGAEPQNPGAGAGIPEQERTPAGAPAPSL